MSFTLILAVTAAVAASMGYLAARKQGEGEPDGDENARNSGEKKPDEKKPDEKKPDEKKPDEKKPGDPPKKAVKIKGGPSPFATLPLALGDVVSVGHEERWLAGALVAREDGRVIGALFLAPEGVQNKAVAVFAPPRKDIYWMSPAELVSPEEPPATIELEGIALARKGRLPVALERLGQGAPLVGEEGVWAVYDRGREVAVVIASQGKVHAWVGKKLDPEEYDRLGGGGD